MPSRAQHIVFRRKGTVERLLSTPVDKETNYWDADTRGLGMRVKPNGAASYVFTYSVEGLPRRVTIGPVRGTALDEARDGAEALRAKANAARITPELDPASLVKKARAVRKASNDAPTFGALVTAFLADRAPALATTTYTEYARILNGERLARLRGRRAAEVTRAELRELLASIAKDGMGAVKRPAPVMARRVGAIIRACYLWARDMEWGGIVDDPTATPRRRRKQTRKERDQSTPARKESLSVEQYGALGDALRRSLTEGLPVAPTLATKGRGGLSAARKAKLTGKTRGAYRKAESPRLTKADPVQVASLTFLALTGWRRMEVYTLRWRDVREADSVAVLPETKTGRSVRPIGSAALRVLAERRANVDGTPDAEPGALVFPMPGRSTKRPEPRHLWYAVRHAAGVPLRLHDLRHSFVTMCRRFGYRDEIIGAAVGHIGSTMTAKYGDIADVQVRVAVDDVSEGIADALRGETARVLELTTPKPRLKLA